MVIKQVSLESVIPIRHQILRANQPISSCYYEEDKFDSTIHFGQYTNNYLVGIISIYAQDQNLQSSEKTWRIRGMAVLPEYQGQGCGAALVTHAVKHLTTRHASLLWCNAHTTACNFYQKIGFARQGLEFDIPGIGAHYIMVKIL